MQKMQFSKFIDNFKNSSGLIEPVIMHLGEKMPSFSRLDINDIVK